MIGCGISLSDNDVAVEATDTGLARQLQDIVS